MRGPLRFDIAILRPRECRYLRPGWAATGVNPTVVGHAEAGVDQVGGPGGGEVDAPAWARRHGLCDRGAIVGVAIARSAPLAHVGAACAVHRLEASAVVARHLAANIAARDAAGGRARDKPLRRRVADAVDAKAQHGEILPARHVLE